MAYRPLLGVGKGYTLLNWEVTVTMIATTLGLVAFAATIERYFFRRATLIETLLFLTAAGGLLWPGYGYDVVGITAFAAAVISQKLYHPDIPLGA